MYRHSLPFVLLPRTLRRAGLVLVLVASVSFTAATEAQPAAANLAVIDALASEIESSDLEDEAREAATEHLAAARIAFGNAVAASERLERLERQVAELPTRLEEVEGRLAQDPDVAVEAWRERLPLESETQTLEDLLAKERSALAALDAEIDDVSVALVETLSGPASAASEVGQLEQRIARLESEGAGVAESPESLLQALELRRQGELQAARVTLELRRYEQQWAASLQELFELVLRDLHLRRDIYVERVEILQTRLAAQGRTELRALVDVLNQRAEELASGPSVVASVAESNRELGEQLAKHNEELARERIELVESELARDRVSQTLRDARIRVEVGSTSKLVGRWLWGERRRLEPASSLENRLERLRDELAGLRLDQVVFSEQRAALDDIQAAAAELTAQAAETSEEGRAAAKTTAALTPLLRQQFELLSLKEPFLHERVEVLQNTERALVQQLEESQELRHLFDRYLMSAPSHEPVNLAWLLRVPENILTIIRRNSLDGAWQRIKQASVERIGMLLLAIPALVLLFGLRRRAPRRIEALAAEPGPPGGEGFRAAAETMAWTLAAALPLPAILLVVGSLFQDIGKPGALGHSIGLASSLLAVPLFSVQLLYWSSRNNGLGHRYFRWARARRRTLLKVLPAAFGVILPMYFLAAVAIARNLELSSDVLARLAIVTACLTAAAALWYSLGAGRLWERRGTEAEPSPLRKLSRLVTTLTALAIAWFALQGFVYSASLLLLDMLSTFTVVVAVSLLVGLVGRWLLLGERRLAASRIEAPAPVLQAADDPEAETAEKPELSLEEVNAQTRRLLVALRSVLIIVGLLWVWSDALPAITRLEEITLWRVAVVGVDGQPESMAISLLAVLVGVAALMVTFAGARNLPGLIEIVLANYTRVDAASRYAVTSVLRYAIVITGTLFALGMLGMQWSRLQWLAAGLTVGLGFGLQEIFANFISGLILLFERPFRVGDIITVGELSGRVMRVRTRATTILDFDNREIVLPNKNFITGQLINWTLSDSTTRLVIPVGVAYGTSPDLVHKLLRQAAREHPDVLAEPESQSWFNGFCASSLDFDLRVFVASPRDRLPVQDALNTRIAQLFAEHGIEIAFPQLDVHLRSTPQGEANPGN